jgi:hypothetical protein
MLAFLSVWTTVLTGSLTVRGNNFSFGLAAAESTSNRRQQKMRLNTLPTVSKDKDVHFHETEEVEATLV